MLELPGLERAEFSEEELGMMEQKRWYEKGPAAHRGVADWYKKFYCQA